MKKNLVKLMACVLATVSLGSLAACGDNGDGPEAIETVEINVWATAEEQAVLETVVAEWNKEHDAINQFKVKSPLSDDSYKSFKRALLSLLLPKMASREGRKLKGGTRVFQLAGIFGLV